MAGSADVTGSATAAVATFGVDGADWVPAVCDAASALLASTALLRVKLRYFAGSGVASASV